MKLTGLTGTGSGKLGSSVFSVSAGTQIVRQYQPVVTNPSTSSQVNNRARLKLMSQLSAVFADVIAIPKSGMQSARNLFVQTNYPVTSAVNGVASANLADIAITRGGMQIPSIVAERVEGTSVSVALASKADQLVARVVYVMFYRNTAGELQLIDSAVVETAGENGTFPYAFPYQERDVIVYAYGIFDKNAKATAKFGNYQVTSGTQIAALIADRKISDSDYLLTKTRGYLLPGETHIEINTIVCNGIPVAATGQTSVAYDESVAVEVSAVDVEGKILAAIVDGQLGEMSAFNELGTAFVGAFNLVGGEVIRVQIGHMNGAQFVPEFTYGGSIVIGAQNTQFTSVTAGGVNIAASGQTQVQQDNEIECYVTATGINGKYLRLSVNGVAQTPVPFSAGEAGDGVINAAVGSVVTFQIGRVVNGTFVEDVAFGGSAVIAEIPPVFSSVSVNGQTIAATGTTSVVTTGSDTLSVTTQNALNKYLGVLNGNNQVLSVHAISSNTISVQLSVAVGDTIKLAIGTGSSTSSFVAQTNFGGSVLFEDAPAVGITSLTVGSTAVNQNVVIDYGSRNVTAAISGADESTQVFAFVIGNTKPTVGTAVSNVSARLSISNGQATGSISFGSNKTNWAAIGTWDETAGTFTPVAVYDYSVYSQDPDN